MRTLRTTVAALCCLLLGWSAAGARQTSAPGTPTAPPGTPAAPRFDELVGANDFRISDMGNTDGSAAFEGRDPAIAYNSTNNEYLVVWRGTDEGSGLAAGEFEVFAQRIDALTGAELGGNDVRISDMGPDGDPSFGVAERPAVAYNSAANEYLVVWVADDNTGLLVDDEFEVFGQRIDGATGQQIGVNDFRISDMGPDGSTAFGVVGPPAVSVLPLLDYLVVWAGDDNTGTLVDDEFEIFAQLIDNGTGAEIWTNDLRVSDMGPDGDTRFGAFTPHIAYRHWFNVGGGGDFLVVWSGDDTVDGELEIFAQELHQRSNQPNRFYEIGFDFQISSTGVAGDAGRDALTPRVSGTLSYYLVVWVADDPDFGLADDEFEVIGKHTTRDGVIQGAEIRLSNMGTDGDPTTDASSPEVIYSPENKLWLVVWSGDDDAGLLVEDEQEIFGQLIDAGTPDLIDSEDLYGDAGFRISDVGTDGDPTRDGGMPAVAFGSSACEYMTVWDADDNGAGSPPLADDELEIFGQRINGASYVLLDDYGGVHNACGPQMVPISPYWGFDIARDLELAPTGFYVLEGFGGIHLGGGAPALSSMTPYFGFDIARDLEFAATGFYVLDGFGGVHFGGGATPVSPPTPYFGFDIARDLEVAPGGYYVLDGFGGLHVGGAAPWIQTGFYLGYDALVDLELAAVGYYMLDSFGNVHAGGGAPPPGPGLPGGPQDSFIDMELSELTQSTSPGGPGLHVLHRLGYTIEPDATWHLEPLVYFGIFAGRDLEFR